MKFLTAYRKLLNGEFKYIKRIKWVGTFDRLYIKASDKHLYWRPIYIGDYDLYHIIEEDAFADDWEGIE